MKQTELSLETSCNWFNYFWRFENSEVLSNNVKGVYVLFDQYRNCLRVGQSRKLRQRIISYFRLDYASWIGEIDSISVYFVEDKENRLMLEEILRLQLKPKYNRYQTFKAEKYLSKTFYKPVNEELDLKF